MLLVHDRAPMCYDNNYPREGATDTVFSGRPPCVWISHFPLVQSNPYVLTFRGCCKPVYVDRHLEKVEEQEVDIYFGEIRVL